MHDEIELKLALSPKQRERLQSSALVRELACCDAKSKKLVSTYFDTPNQDLRRKGMALRIRQSGGKRIQTLKAPGTRTDGLQNFREYEAEVKQDRPDLSLIKDRALQAELRKGGLAETLEPVFTTRFDRQTIPLKLDESEVELAIDVGEIESGGRRMAISEAELELKSGRPSRLYELALALHDKVSFHLERRTKAARGYGLREGSQPQPVKATAVALTPDMTAAEAFAAATRACLTQIRTNEQVVLAGRDPEGVHQLRVGVRRLRAVIGAFHRIVADEVLDYLRGELRWLQLRLGPAREWDVFIHETIDPMQAEAADGDLAVLREAARQARSDGYRQARRAITAARYTALLLRLELWLDQGGWEAPAEKGKAEPGATPAPRFAAKSLRRRHRKLHKLADKHRDLSVAELHRVRIRAKQLRYAADVFRSLFPAKPVKRQLAALEDIQDALGTLNDAVVSKSMLTALIERVGRRDAGRAARLQQAAGLVEAWQARRIERDHKLFGKCWQRYRALEPYWKA